MRIDKKIKFVIFNILVLGILFLPLSLMLQKPLQEIKTPATTAKSGEIVLVKSLSFLPPLSIELTEHPVDQNCFSEISDMASLLNQDRNCFSLSLKEVPIAPKLSVITNYSFAQIKVRNDSQENDKILPVAQLANSLFLDLQVVLIDFKFFGYSIKSFHQINSSLPNIGNLFSSIKSTYATTFQLRC